MIFKRRRAQREGKYPFGLSAEHLDILKTLPDAPGWVILTRVLDDVIEFNAEALLASTRPEDIHFRRGIVWALRELASLPEAVIAHSKRLDNDRRRYQAQRDGKAERDWRATFFASPWFDYARRFHTE